jgi:puromycin-sensitive aminopeptidase
VPDATETIATDADPYRLPRTARPSRYELSLEPDLQAFTFTGSVAISIEVVEATDELVLNAIELELTDVVLVGGDGTTTTPTGVDYDETTERATLRFASALATGPATLRIAFSGLLNDKLHGFYRSTFADADGEQQVIATTQFEATDARRAFPCWDEPEYKAVFAVSLVVDPDLAAVSNAAEVSRTSRGDGKDVVAFADTISMSTYLVAFIVGPLDVTDPVDVDGTPLRVVYPRGKGHLTAYALDVGAFCLHWFADYFGLPYAGDKLDLVAVPDFAFGAMENLGCVTFREALVLVEPTEVTQLELQNVTDVIAHELAHMWFGDLVTMKWWNGIWLNEAFATFMEMSATDAFKPEWERWVSFGLSRTMAFDTDSLQTTRPIEFPVVSPDDAEGMFDVLTYEKGAAVVRMLEQYLGADRFREGIREYMRRHQFGNTETTDLWDAIESVTDEPVRRIMDSWIFQGGHPLVRVELVHDEFGEVPPAVRFHQERFGYAGDKGEGDPELSAALAETRWVVPLLFTQSAGGAVTVEKVLLEGDEVEVGLEMAEPFGWVLANTEGTGFYRVAYSADLRDALLARAQSELSPIERYGLVDDAWAAVLADRMTAVEFLELVLRLGDEADLSVWQRMSAGLGSVDRLVSGEARQALQAHVRDVVGPALERLGREPRPLDSDRERNLRGVLIETVGVVGADPELRAFSREVVASVDRQGEDAKPPDPSVLSAAIAVTAASGGADDYDEFHRRCLDATTPQQELRYLYALAAFDDGDLVDRLTASTLSDEIRSQNAPYVLGRAMGNRDHGSRAWAFVRDHWDEVNDRFPSNSIVRMLGGVRALDRPEVADDVFAFFEAHEVPQGDQQLAQHLERLEVNVALRARASEDLAQHLTR